MLAAYWRKKEAERGENVYVNDSRWGKVGGRNFQRRTSRKNKGTKWGRASGRVSMRCNVRVRQLHQEMEAV